jgi:hypothetical protein
MRLCIHANDKYDAKLPRGAAAPADGCEASGGFEVGACMPAQSCYHRLAVVQVSYTCAECEDHSQCDLRSQPLVEGSVVGPRTQPAD